MDDGTKIVLLLSLASTASAVWVIAKHRPGRFLLTRVADAELHRAATRRVLAIDALVFVAAALAILLSSDPTTAAIACPTAALVPPIWMLVELRLGLKKSAPTPVPSRFRVSLEPPPSLLSFLSPPLQLLNASALLLPLLLLAAIGEGSLGAWFYFLPMMLFLTALISFIAWMQARERWVLPAAGTERYLELQRERRARTIRLLESGMVSWNVASAAIWICLALGRAGPWNAGAILPVLLAGPGFVILLALQLPRLTRIADELAALAGTDALGTRGESWRWGGLIYYAPSDPALFVTKRSGVGQTLNFARPAAWLFLAGVLLLPCSITLLAVATSG